MISLNNFRKLENKFEYPELQSSYSVEEKGSWSSLINTTTKLEKSKSSGKPTQKKKEEEFKKVEDYIVQDPNEGVYMSDLLAFATIKKSKSKRK